jgi:hypothetical protein
MSYALIAIVAALIVANVATAYQLWRTMRDFAAEMVALAQSEADLMVSRSNEETAIKAARDAADLVDALRANYAEERKVAADAKDVEIDNASPEQLVALGNRRELPDTSDAPANTGAGANAETLPVREAPNATKVKSNFRR